MTQPNIGFVINRSSTEARPAILADLSVAGFVLPSDDAVSETFPLNVPVAFDSGDQDYLEDIGTGPLAAEIKLFNAQLDDFQVSGRVVVVRVAQGANIDETITNIIGNSSSSSGIYALLRAGPMLGLIPRLIGVGEYAGKFSRSEADTDVSRTAKPGGNTGNGVMTLAGTPYDGNEQNGIYTVRFTGGAKSATLEAPAGNTGNGILGTLTADTNAAVGTWSVVCQVAGANAGTFAVIRPNGSLDGIATVDSAYNGGINFTIADGSTDFIVGDDFNIAVAASIPANGGTFEVRDPYNAVVASGTVGNAFNNQIAFTIADGSTDFVVGDGFDVTVVKSGGVAEANPIVAALPAVLSQLLAHAYVDGPATSIQDGIDWRETINSDRIVPVDARSGVYENGSVVWRSGSSAVIGQQVATDFLHSGIPSHSACNRPIQGIVSLKRYDAFSLLDGATAGQRLLENNIGIFQRGELGVETAAANSGFVYLGTDNAGDDELWRFYSVTRMRDFIHLTAIRLLRVRLGRSNITPHTAQAVLNDLEFLLRDLKADFHILDYRVGFDKSKNSPEQLRLGHLRVNFKGEEAPPLKLLTIDSERYRPALETLLDDLIVQANTLAA